MFLFRLVEAFDREKIPYAVVGGYAVALHGAVRGTIDVDLVLNLARRDFEGAEKALRSIGLESRLPVSASQVFDFREDYIKNRNLIAWSFYNPLKPIEVVDILMTETLKKVKTVMVRAGGQKIKIASISDLIRMKKKSGRPQDLADIEALQRIRK